MRFGDRRRDQGAVLILVALLLTVLMIVVAFAIDLGQGRFARRDNQTAVDLAAVAAGYFMAGNGTSVVVSNPQEACKSAIRSVQINLKDFSPTTSAEAACAGYPITSVLCPSQPATPNVTVSDTKYTVTVRYPVPDTELESERFATGVNDGTDPCTRMRVSLTRTDQTYFAAIMGIDEIESAATAVVTGTIDPGSPGVPSFLMLERVDCGVLGNSVGGDSRGIVVLANPEDAQPGYIHVDSYATGTCNDTNTLGGFAVFGTPLPDGTPSTVINDYVNALGEEDPGILSVVATNGRAAYTYPTGIDTAPTAFDPVSRYPVDERYEAGITLLHSAAHTELTKSGAPPGYSVYSCDGTLISAGSPADVFVDCPADYGGSGAPWAAAAGRVVFSHGVNLGNADILLLPQAKEVIVRGQFAVNTGDVLVPDIDRLYVGNRLTVGNGGSFAMGYATPTIPNLSDGSPGQCPPSPGERRELVIFGGATNAAAFDSAADMTMCSTTVYLAGPLSAVGGTYVKRLDDQRVTHATCTPTRPCPLITGNVTAGARFEFNGAVRWSAPDQYDEIPEGVPQGLEDLALITEGPGVIDVKSGGELIVTGVSYAPNATVQLRSPATAVPFNAQFIARKLFLFQGTLQMKPAEADAVTIPKPGTFRLIR